MLSVAAFVVNVLVADVEVVPSLSVPTIYQLIVFPHGKVYAGTVYV